jgi:hypothetical protein
MTFKMTSVGKIISIGAAALALATTAAFAQPASVSGSGNVCLKTILIDRTVVPNEHTILFYMKDGKVWQNTLKSDCPGLKINGFVYAPTPPDQVCGDLQTLRAIQTGSVCTMGAFVPYEGRAVPSQNQTTEQSPPPPTSPDKMGY